jgi:hypothetical protein
MKTTAGDFPNAILDRLLRKPVLTAMIVMSLIYGVTASIAGIVLWRGDSGCATAQSGAGPKVAQVAWDGAGRGNPMMDGDSPSVAESVSTACSCTSSNQWHWQRI